jgi:hypothetical protein
MNDTQTHFQSPHLQLLQGELSMSVTSNLSVKAMAQIRRLLQGEVKRSFKLTDQDDVVAMLKYANISEDRQIMALLDDFLVELPASTRSELAAMGIRGAVASVSDTPSKGVPTTSKGSGRSYRGQRV